MHKNELLIKSKTENYLALSVSVGFWGVSLGLKKECDAKKFTLED